MDFCICRVRNPWIDFDLTDGEGNLALQSFLMSLPDNLEFLPNRDLQFLNYLLEQRTRMRRWFRSQPDYVNHPNRQGNTALHFAAKLADSRFYHSLARFGDTEKLNDQGLSPKEVFNSRRARVKNYDQ